MKKVIVTILIIIICFSLQACDIYAGKRPNVDENMRWVSQEPNIWFVISEKYGDLTGSISYGQVNIDGVITEFATDFDYGTGIRFRPIASYRKGEGINDEWLFEGKCKFSPDKLVVKIVNNDKGFLDDSIKQIIFIKEEIPDDV